MWPWHNTYKQQRNPSLLEMNAIYEINCLVYESVCIGQCGHAIKKCISEHKNSIERNIMNIGFTILLPWIIKTITQKTVNNFTKVRHFRNQKGHQTDRK